jgi:hypothetical protein
MSGLMSSVTLTLTLVLGMPNLASVVPILGPRADFTGTWVLDVDSSDFGMSPPADSGVTTITRADDHLLMSRTIYGSMGQHGHVEFDMPIDGTVHDGVGIGGTPVPASARWTGDTLVLTVIGQSNVGAIEIVDHMTVDGDVLRIERTVAIPGVPVLMQSLVLRRRSE